MKKGIPYFELNGKGGLDSRPFEKEIGAWGLYYRQQESSGEALP